MTDNQEEKGRATGFEILQSKTGINFPSLIVTHKTTIRLSFAMKQHKNSLPASSIWSLTIAPLAPIGYVRPGGT